MNDVKVRVSDQLLATIDDLIKAEIEQPSFQKRLEKEVKKELLGYDMLDLIYMAIDDNDTLVDAVYKHTEKTIKELVKKLK